MGKVIKKRFYLGLNEVGEVDFKNNFLCQDIADLYKKKSDALMNYKNKDIIAFDVVFANKIKKKSK